MSKKSKHYLLAEQMLKQNRKKYGIPKEDVLFLTKRLSRDILRSMVKNEFILVKVKLDKK